MPGGIISHLQPLDACLNEPFDVTSDDLTSLQRVDNFRHCHLSIIRALEVDVAINNGLVGCRWMGCDPWRIGCRVLQQMLCTELPWWTQGWWAVGVWQQQRKYGQLWRQLPVNVLYAVNVVLGSLAGKPGFFSLPLDLNWTRIEEIQHWHCKHLKWLEKRTFDDFVPCWSGGPSMNECMHGKNNLACISSLAADSAKQVSQKHCMCSVEPALETKISGMLKQIGTSTLLLFTVWHGSRPSIRGWEGRSYMSHTWVALSAFFPSLAYEY